MRGSLKDKMANFVPLTVLQNIIPELCKQKGIETDKLIITHIDRITVIA